LSAPEQLLTLQPATLDANGAAVARTDDLRVHVAGALPGETVTARLVHRSPHRHPHDDGHDAWGELQDVLVASPERVPPVCPGYGSCGGCVLQHLSLAGQLSWKRQQVVEALATVPGALPTVAACASSPLALGYRNQAKYVVARAGGTGAGLVLGAYAPRSHRVVDLAGCRLGEPPQDEVAAKLRELLLQAGIAPYDERNRTGLLRYVVVRTNAQAQVLVALVTARPEFPQGPALAQALAQAIPAVVTVVHNVNDSTGNVIFGTHELPLLGPGVLEEHFGKVGVEIGARAFVQLNRGVAQLAYAAIGQALQVARDAGGGAPLLRVLDLYSGVGAIAFSLAEHAREIIAIESNPAATSAGQAAAARAGLAHVRFVTGAVAAAIAEPATFGAVDAVVLNPPRAGADAVVCAAIARMRPGVVVYLSCNPATLARDVTALRAADESWVVESVQPFDMLPHTTHVETLAVLRRSARRS
jgi:23S rRNA (uracil1939-C5)-methyltransferase